MRTSARHRTAERTPTGSEFRVLRNRSLTLVCAAVAVLGAASGAALLVPSPPSRAQAADLATATGPDLAGSASATRGATASAPAQQPADPEVAAPRAVQDHVDSSARTPTTATAATQPSTPVVSVSAASTTTASVAPATSRLPTPTGPDLRAIIARSAPGRLLDLGSSTYVVRDFDSRLMGADLGTDGIRGAGSDSTVIEMVPHSSTKATAVPTTAYRTNQLYLLSTIGGTPGLSGFTLTATDQGHLYNGLRVGRATNARVSDVRIENVPGDASFPPGETFLLNDWRTTGSVYDRITIDGGGVAAAGFGINSSSDITIDRSTFTGTAHSSGGAFWQSRNITLNDVSIVDNRSGLNFERDTGTIRLNRPTFSGNRLYDLQFGSDWGGAQVIISDPVLAPGQKIRINAPLTYHGGTNDQKRSDIHVIVGGVDRTRELVQFL